MRGKSTWKLKAGGSVGEMLMGDSPPRRSVEQSSRASSASGDAGISTPGFDLHRWRLLIVADVLNRRGNDRRWILWVMKLQMHAAPHKLQLQHGAAPGRARDCNQNRLRTKLRMPGYHRVVAAQKHGPVAMVHGLNFKHGRRRQIVQEHAPFNLRLDDAAVDLIAQIGVGGKHTNDNLVRLKLFRAPDKGRFQPPSDLSMWPSG